MNRLTLDERRRANELRRIGTQRRTSDVLVLDDMRMSGWKRNARVAMFLTLVLGGVLAVTQLAHALSLYGPGSLLDWLLPRL